MKSDPKSEKCKECYERVRKYKSVLLFCEVMGYCKKEGRHEKDNL
jgi:hypothetical protein